MRFGILGTATIAEREFVPAVRTTAHEVAAVASRSADRAAAFAAAHDIPESYGDYERLLAEAAIDAVYVPLPHGLHAEWVRRAADNGRHVLCEKPLALTAAEADALGEYCRDRGVVLMEALMYRYHPRTERAVAVAREQLGDRRTLFAAFHSSLRSWPSHFRFDPELGGGSLLDVGVYAVSAARLLLDEPVRAYALTADPDDRGVDMHTMALLEFSDDRVAAISSSFDAGDAQFYRVHGTDGWLGVEEGFTGLGELPTELEYQTGDRTVTEAFPPADPFALEIEHFAACVDSGSTPRTSAAEASRTLAVIDAIRESGATGRPVDVG